MRDEELVLLEEQLATAQADIATLEERLADAEAAAATHSAAAVDLRRVVAGLETSLAEQRQSLETRDHELVALQERLDVAETAAIQALGRFREAVLRLEPELPAELVTGTTVEEVEASLQFARETVARVRERLSDQAQSLRVPSGAPARAAPDIGSLSATEKIRLGLQDR